MKFEVFRKKYHGWPVISSADVVREDQAEYQVTRNQLSRWSKKGTLVPLRKGMYAFNPEDVSSSPEILYIANRLYEPSYISLEYALSLYELIPEYVPTVTSVTTRKTMAFKNALGHFSYQHVVSRAFRGFRQEKQGQGRQVFVAEPEKAVLDFLYLNMPKFREDFEGILIGSFRFQNLETLVPSRILDLSACYENGRLSRMAVQLNDLIRKGKVMIDVIKQQFTNAMPRHMRLNKTREFMQALCLKIMSERGTFDQVAFFGGTALRMMFQLRRFSEDLDFSILKAGKLDVPSLSETFIKDFRLYGFQVESKVKAVGAVRSMMLKFPGLLKDLGLSPLKDEKIAIKWDVDTNPPQGGAPVGGMMNKYFTFRVVHYDLPSLFAGKLHACIFRNYPKGRDWYDFIWYVSKRICPNLVLLKNAVRQTEKKELEVDDASLANFLTKAIEHVDLKAMGKNVERFLEDPAELSIFDADAVAQTIRNNYSD